MNLNRRIPLRDPEPQQDKPDMLCLAAWALLAAGITILAFTLNNTKKCSSSSPDSSAVVSR